MANGLRRSLTATSAIAEAEGATYLFCLQPTLLDGCHELTPDDEQFVKARRETEVMGFSYEAFFTAYYHLLKQEFPQDSCMGPRMKDFSALLNGQDPTCFVDTCHFGDRGQQILAEKVAQSILALDSEG